jgi:tRNA modification GTPase
MALAGSGGTNGGAVETGGGARETIVAISTPPGRGGIGIVRVSGVEALRVASAVVTLRLDERTPHALAQVTRVRGGVGIREQGLGIRKGGDTIDEAVVTVFHAPRSYTGETLVEMAAHGAPVVLESMVRMALGAGARLAGPGEFTQRAFLAGRLDLTQVEAVGDLIAAQTLDQARVAAQQMGGSLSRRVAPAKERLLHLIALLEAGMDFASGELDDVDVVPVGTIAAEIAAVAAEMEALAGSYARGQLLRQGAAIALVGPPNAGKSSLFNRLLERERAIVTPVAGTTRDTLEEAVSVGGVPVRLVDTAGLRAGIREQGLGIRDGVDAAEVMGMERSREAMADADLVVVVHDASLAVTEEERGMVAGLRDAGRPFVVVWNKVDLVAGVGAEAGVVRTSAVTGEGLEALRGAVLMGLGAGGGVGDGAVLNTLRQREAVEQTLKALRAASAANAGGMPHEAVLLDLHAALGGLDALTGQTTAEDVLGRIFAAFCIGK